MPEELNRRLREAFDEHNLNPSSLAERAGISRSTVHQWLKRPDLTVDALTLRKVAEYLGWSPEDTFRWADLLPPRGAGDPIVEARQALTQLPMRPAARGALLKLAEELSRVSDDDCRLRFEDAWRVVSGKYAAGDQWKEGTLLATVLGELRAEMFDEPSRTAPQLG
jgi:transcriptional regulator with XRE-family HTH domain